MKKELDKELYPDYVYPEFTPDPGKPFREPIAKLGKKIQTVFRRSWVLKRSPEMIRSIGDWPECLLMRKHSWH